MHDVVAAPTPVHPGPSAAPAPARPALWRIGAWTALDLLIAGVIVFGFAMLAAFVLGLVQARGVDLGPRQPTLGGLPALFVPISLIGTLLAGAALWLLHRRRLPSAPTPWTPRLLLLVIGIAAALQAAAIAFATAVEHFGSSASGTNLAIIEAAFAAAPWSTLLMAVVLAPLGEELVFRRVLLHRFAQARRPWLGLAVTSLGFAFIHEPLPAGRDLLAWLLPLATYASLGAGFGLLYLRCGRLDAVVLAHVLVNAVGMALLLAA
jgi:membrane protease YdiL (CAAX protease family)